jgi:hypothetical protein
MHASIHGKPDHPGWYGWRGLGHSLQYAGGSPFHLPCILHQLLVIPHRVVSYM